jgi:SAM-dependent methyltransferase
VSEAGRIQQLYETEYGPDGSRLWTARDPRAMYFRHVVERAVAAVLNDAGATLDGDVLDVGCGGGAYTRFLVDLGADPARTTGIDLVPQRIEAAGRASPPSMRWQVADATELPFADDSFDLVAQFTALCNLLDAELRRRAAREMARVLRPGGLVLWFDVSRSRLRELHGIAPAELRVLFPGVEMMAERRVLVRGSWLMAGRAPAIWALVEAASPVLPCTNLAAVLRPR